MRTRTLPHPDSAAAQIWVEMCARYAAQYATTAGLNARTAQLTISTGGLRRDDADVEFETAEGAVVRTLMEERLFKREPSSEQYGCYGELMGWSLGARGGMLPGVLQVWNLKTLDGNRDVFANLWIPRLSTWCSHPELVKLTVEDAVRFAELFDVLTRVDGTEAKLAIEGSLLLL